MSKFIHLHNHSDNSLLDGAISVKTYVKAAKEHGMEAIALTDHGNMYGVIPFYLECKSNGIKPIVGCEFYVNPPNRKEKSQTETGSRAYHLVLLAMNDTGYHNLLKLSSLSFTEGFYYRPRIDDELIEKYNEGLICLSACLAGEILQHLMVDQYNKAKERALWFKGIFGDRYYLELQNHGLPEQIKTNPMLKKLSQELDIPLVCTNDIHYLNKNDAEAHDIILCVGSGKKVDESPRLKFPNDNFYFKSADEMEELFSEYPEAIANTVVIADRCDGVISFPKNPILPDFDIPEEFADEKEYLKHITIEGCKMRYGEITPVLQERLDFELNTICNMGFEGYFLIVMDYIKWAKENDIPVGPGRGSGAGSLVAYCTEITNVEPLKYDLLFERFLNPERVSMPDFDIDFCMERRLEVIDYVTEKYGKEKVGQIATFGTLKAKAVVKDCARALSIPFDESNKIAKLISDDAKNLDKAIEMEPKLQEIIDTGGVYATLFKASKILEGLNRHISTHAAGVVIGKTELSDYVPLCTDPKTGNLSTQYTMKYLEMCGLVKMDFLGLKTLTLIKHTLELVHRNEPDFDIEKIDECDALTFEMLQKGDSSCVFQFESAGMQKILRDAKPENIEDLVALNALYRPGPMDNIPKYIRSKNGLEEITYPDDELEPVLKNTYGVIVYQEQVMQVAQIIAGYTLGEADILRRIMGKKDVKALPAEREKFIQRAVELGRDKQHATDIFDLLVPFAGYGFNKSHAVAYSIVAYQTAYLKAHYPAQFLAANLTNEMSNPAKFSEYLALVAAMGLTIAPPDINKSYQTFNVVENDIVYGLAGIKNVGGVFVKQLINEREKNGPYTSFLNFLDRQDDVNSRVVESLIKAGVFDSLGENRATLLGNLEEALNYNKSIKANCQYGQISLFGDSTEEINQFTMRQIEDLNSMEKLLMEKEYLGFYVSGHPLDAYKEDINRAVWVDISDLSKVPIGRTINLVAQASAVRQIITKKGARMMSLTLTNHDGSVEAIIFPRAYEQINPNIENDNIYGFRGNFNDPREGEETKFVIDAILRPSELQKDESKHLIIEFTSINDLTEENLIELKKYCFDNTGDTSIEAIIPGKKGKVMFGSNFNIKCHSNVLAELKEIRVIKDAWFS